MQPKPDFIEKFGHYYLLWFCNFNTYTVVDDDFYSVLKSYIHSSSNDDFIALSISERGLSQSEAETELHILENFFVQTTKANRIDSLLVETVELDKQPEKDLFYKMGDKTFKISLNSNFLISLINPTVAHLEVAPSKHIDLYLQITQYKDQLILKDNEGISHTFQKSALNKLLGKLLTYFINQLHGISEMNWMGFFHASAVQRHHQALMFMGSSGSGKSTLVSLLAAHGFQLVADDMVPIKAKDKKLYQNPSAVSVKHSSLDLVSKYWPNQDTHTPGLIDKGKGPITYIPMQTGFDTEGYPCQHLIKVNYQPETATTLVPLDFKAAMEILIPESWIAPAETNARSFMSWLKTLQFWELSYSDFKEVLPLLEDLTNP